MRVQISFKQFNPSKPAKYGLLFKSINAALYPYTFIMVVYYGKPKGPPSEFYVPGPEEIVKSMVSRSGTPSPNTQRKKGVFFPFTVQMSQKKSLVQNPPKAFDGIS